MKDENEITHYAIGLGGNRVYLQRIQPTSAKDSSLSDQEEIIIKLYKELEEYKSNKSIYLVVNNSGVISYNGFRNEEDAIKFISGKPSLHVDKITIEY